MIWDGQIDGWKDLLVQNGFEDLGRLLCDNTYFLKEVFCLSLMHCICDWFGFVDWLYWFGVRMCFHR